MNSRRCRNAVVAELAKSFDGATMPKVSATSATTELGTYFLNVKTMTAVTTGLAPVERCS
jgi:hypothetical protein